MRMEADAGFENRSNPIGNYYVRILTLSMHLGGNCRFCYCTMHIQMQDWRIRPSYGWFAIRNQDGTTIVEVLNGLYMESVPGHALDWGCVVPGVNRNITQGTGHGIQLCSRSLVC